MIHKQHSHKIKDKHREKNDPITFETQFFAVMIELVSHQIKIHLQRRSTELYYEYSITQETIELNSELNAFYSGVDALFQDLRQSYSQILINQDGVIIFELSLQVLGKTSKKQIKFYSKKKQSTDLLAKINQMAEEHYRQMELMKAQHVQQISLLRRQIEEIKARLMTYEANRIQPIIPNPNIPTHNPYGPYGINFTSLGIYEQGNTNKKFFTVKKTEKSVRVIRIVYDGTSRNFVLNAKIPKGRVNVVAFKQTKTKSCFVRYGIVSKNLVSSSNTFFDKQSISLYAYNGQYTTASKQKYDGKAIKDGSIIKMTIDTFSWTVNWNITQNVASNFEIETYIPQEMKGLDLFVCVSMQEEGDQIELTIVE